MKKNMHQSGFTLIELLLYLGITSIIVLATSALTQTVLEARIKYQTVSEVEQQGQQAMQMIGQSLRNAKKVCSPTAGGVAIATLTIDPAAVACTTTNVFDVSGGALRIKEGAAAAVNLTNTKVTVSGFSVDNFAASSSVPSSVQVKFTITYINNSGKNEYNYAKSFESAATLRCAGGC